MHYCLFSSPLIGIRYIATKVKSAREEEALLGLSVSLKSFVAKSYKLSLTSANETEACKMVIHTSKICMFKRQNSSSCTDSLVLL